MDNGPSEKLDKEFIQRRFSTMKYIFNVNVYPYTLKNTINFQANVVLKITFF